MSAQDELTAYLKAISDHFPNQQTLERVVFEHGRAFTPPVQPRPKGIRKGRNKMCFMNSAHLMYSEGYRYTEGFAISATCPFPMQHAWVITEDDTVIETTWKESGLAYYGIVLEQDLMDKVLFETRTYGVLDYTSKTFRERFLSRVRNMYLNQ